MRPYCQKSYLRGGYEGHLQKKKTKPMVTLASAHPDHKTVSVGARGHFSKMTYKVLQVYDKASGSVAGHRAGRHTKHSRAADEGDVVPIESNDGHAWASNQTTQVLRPFTQETSSRTEARAISEELIDGL